MFCDECDKRVFTSKHTARAALTGQLKSKRIRVYPCPSHKGTWHVTKEAVTRIDNGNRRGNRDRQRRSGSSRLRTGRTDM